MDFSKFSDAEFDVKEWVNGALRAHKDSQTPVDVSAEAEKYEVTSSLASWLEAITSPLHIAHSDHFSGTCIHSCHEVTALHSGIKFYTRCKNYIH